MVSIRGGSAVITFKPPTDNGGSHHLQYRVIQNPGGKVIYDSGSPIRITNVKAGDTFTIEDINEAGEIVPVNVGP